MKVSVFGLGYVGCVSAACFADEGNQVIGVDVNADKVNIINNAKSPIIEKGLEEKIARGIESGNLSATTDFKFAIENSEISIICVGTPSEPNGNVKLDYIYRVAEQIGSVLKHTDHFHVFVIRSTVPPGTLNKCLNIIETQSGKFPGVGFGGCSNPEFLREGTALEDFYNAPYTVVGESDKKSGDMLAELYQKNSAELIRTDVKVAEMIKYANNTFHALKVAFANEIGSVCKSQNVDSHKLMDIFVKDTKLNLSPYYLKPGFAFGGSCLPKDVRALAYMTKKNDLDLPVISSIIPSNNEHIRRAFNMIQSYDKKKIGIMGLSFKGNTDDLRESPMVEIVEMLIGKGYEVLIYDENVHLAKLFGANKEYINKKIPHISRLLVETMDELIENSELIVIGNKNKKFENIMELKKEEAEVFDLVRLNKNLDDIGSKYNGIGW